jgi:Ca2+-binding EF-hand superfamily protein
LSDPDRSRKFGNEEKLMSLTEEEFEALEETFAYNDANNDGKIEYQEFLAMLDALEAGMKADEARVGFDEIDTDNDGSIELDEFIDWWRDG